MSSKIKIVIMIIINFDYTSFFSKGILPVLCACDGECLAHILNEEGLH